MDSLGKCDPAIRRIKLVELVNGGFREVGDIETTQACSFAYKEKVINYFKKFQDQIIRFVL